ncbi:MAG: hypothetical protein JNK73_02520 [Bacteroidia bacterium]|nr:hypothetical protein [Bacteroidia bacterium]
MTKTLTLFLFSLGLTLAVACKKKKTTTTTPCAQTWTVSKSQDAATTNITGSYLHLRCDSTIIGAAVSVYRTNLTGDFTATVHYEGFQGGTSGNGWAQLVASDPLLKDSGILVCGINSSSISAMVADKADDIQSVVASSGTVTIARVGKKITVTHQAGIKTATCTANFLNTALNIGFQIGSNLGTTFGPLQIRIKDITVTGPSGTIFSDGFDCDSRKP